MKPQTSMVWCEAQNQWAGTLAKNTAYEIHDRIARRVVGVGGKAYSVHCKPAKGKAPACRSNVNACTRVRSAARAGGNPHNLKGG